MSQLKLIIVVTPYFFENDLIDEYISKTEEIRDFLKDTMVNYLGGAFIKYGGGEINIKLPTGNLASSVHESSVRMNNNSFFTSLTVSSHYASFVEFGTGMHGELASPHMIETKTYHNWGGDVKGKYMHWEDHGEDFYFMRVRGQYPKPFMRGAIMKLENEYEMIKNFEIYTKIIHPMNAKFEKTVSGV